jgi:outer membrane protein OmpA-like peptidoglycan-associated protein
LQPFSVVRVPPPPPYDTQTFTIYFEFGRDFLMYQHSEVILDKVLVYAKATQSKNIRIQGFAATDAIEVSHRSLAEPLALAEARARMVEKALLLLGVPPSALSVAWLGSPAPTDLEGGRLPEPSKRRVTITITP